MSKLISYSSTLNKSIKLKGILNSTKFISYSNLEEINWDEIKEFHILGSIKHENDRETILDVEISTEQYGCYISADKTWLFILGAPVDKISYYVSKCTSNLKTLDIRFTSVEEINLSHITNIKRLQLGENHSLSSLIGLQSLYELQVLDLKRTILNGELDISKFHKLYSLSVRDTMINNIIIDKPLELVHHFDAANSGISNCDFIMKFPSLQLLNLSGTAISKAPNVENLNSLEILNISNTKIDTIPNINCLQNLRTFNVAYTNISDISTITFPSSVRSILLSGTPIKHLPYSIKFLDNLRRLALCDMTLDDLPSWLPELNLEFVTEYRNYGICLNNTIVPNVDMSIFNQPRSVIEAWFKANVNISQNGARLNESKVIFLGDGGAGKSLAIQRLLRNGEYPIDFDGNATPGISITSKEYCIADREISVHFWDFGGQEILHSMHRMFLTKRTLYVVLVNARDNTQDERARYWLHNIKSFANGSKVLLVLNQIDQNPTASVNETSLKVLYPDLTRIIKLSAKEYSTTDFKQQFESALLEEISEMPTLNEPFLPSWNLLKSKLQHMTKHYIDENEYALLSNECGVENEIEIRNSLIDWFSDLGISFCYRDNSVLSNYMILRPDWITNAIYIILFNSSGNVHNGLIKHETIHQLLHPTSKTPNLPKSVISGLKYTSAETEYVLGVIRKFRLSYRIDDDTEFIPMLCERNESPIAKLFVADDDILEFHMQYVYLPNNVMHRLMVEMRSQLEVENVWLTGAVFSQASMGLRALVKAEDNVLKIFVKSTNQLHPANTYLNIIKSTIERINESLGLSSTEQIVYREESITECFDYDYLIDSYNHGNREIYSREFRKNIKILDVLNQSDKDVEDRRTRLLEDILNVCQMMQSNKLYWHTKENERNTYVRDMLRSKGYYIADQTLSGQSASGKSPGELDIEIRYSAEKSWTVYEALNITSFSDTNKSNWNEHLQRLLDNYNPIGYPFLFLVSYLECSKDNFKEMWLKYYEHISTFSLKNYMLQKMINHSNDSFYIRSAECVYDRAGLPTTVYHICVRLGE